MTMKIMRMMIKKSLVGDKTDFKDKGLTHKGSPIDKTILVANVSSKPSFPKLVNANSTLPGFLNFQSTCDLNGMPSNFVNSQLQNQLPNMPMNNMASSLGNICSGLQGSLIGFPNPTMGAWNPLHQLKATQVLQTLTSLGVGNLGQQGGSQMFFGKYIEQDPKCSLFKVVASLESVATIPPSKDLMFRFDDWLEGLDMLTIGMNKKN